ncbi:MAG: pseudouridine synthase [Nitrospirales bacterium]|nr:MAG: pseudouridine synthase [Nitrospirales bacterium]
MNSDIQRLTKYFVPIYDRSTDHHSTMITEFLITNREKRKRLDMFLVYRQPEISRSRLQRLIEEGRIRVNTHIVKPSQKIKPGDRITMDQPQASDLRIMGRTIALDILHEDEALIVVNKPAGIVMHPTSGNWSGTLLNGLLSHFQATNQEPLTPGIVHRLDKDTSGVLVIAKNRNAHRTLAKQFETHTITRHYEAITLHTPTKKEGVIDLAIGRDTYQSKKHSSQTLTPRSAITEYRAIQQWPTLASHIMLSPRTGRTHQLRVHLASLGTPILGDFLYGGTQACRIVGIVIPRVMLHAHTLGFQHPVSGKFTEYTIDAPSDMQIVRTHLERIDNSIQA